MKNYMRLFLLTNLITVPVLILFAYINMVVRLGLPLSINILAGPTVVGLIMGGVIAYVFHVYLKKIKLLQDEKHQEQMKRKEQEVVLLHQSKMAAIGGMIAAIAHQWKQPLNVVSLVTQTIESKINSNKLTDEFTVEMLGQVKEQIKFMSNTINDFRNFFNPDKEKVVFDIKDEVQKSASIIGHVCKNYFIDLSISGENGLVKGVKNELHHVIVNIVNNAKDVLNEREVKDKKITIEISKDEEKAYVKIKDNAGGIPEENISKIFDPYFTTKGEDGTGIGLYMTKMIINESFNGDIYVKNGEEGAVFTITIPLVEE